VVERSVVHRPHVRLVYGEPLGEFTNQCDPVGLVKDLAGAVEPGKGTVVRSNSLYSFDGPFVSGSR
jgi:hypothetical protein